MCVCVGMIFFCDFSKVHMYFCVQVVTVISGDPAGKASLFRIDSLARDRHIPISHSSVSAASSTRAQYSCECFEFVTRVPSIAEHNSVWHTVKDWKQKEF